jgi:hypothetical protein
VSLGQTVINVGAQSVQRNFALNFFLGARDFRAAQATTDYDANTLGVRAHGFLHRLLHGAAERNTLL